MPSDQLLTIAHHVSRIGRGRMAHAPYNFVPLPERVVVAAENAVKDLPDHNRYYSDRYSGYFDVILTTRSPLYVRCATPREDFLRRNEEDDAGLPFRQQVKNRPDFFYTTSPEQPVIPGSSLRGMLRGLLEIVTYGKLQWVTKKNLFFRTVDDTAVGKYYRGRMGEGKVEAGFFQRQGNDYVIRPCQFARVDRAKLPGNLYSGSGPNAVPRWRGQPHQWERVWVTLVGGGQGRQQVQEISFTQPPTPGAWQEGVLVITGNVPNKKKEFVFLLPPDKEAIPVPEALLERFHDDDQLTQWQQRAFSRDEPHPNCRRCNGMIRTQSVAPGDPVFFLREDDQLVFFGRAQMFRLPYRHRPFDLVPEELRRPNTIDYAEALFGYVRTKEELDELSRQSPEPRQGSKARAYAGRVAVTDARLVPDAALSPWLTEEPIVPKILATPKPTAFQHYLVQPTDDKDNFKHYDSTIAETAVRGHKLYWHKGRHPIGVQDLRESDPYWLDRNGEVKASSTQHTQFRPVRPGARFSFRVYFENLNECELGALCWTLHPLGEPGHTYFHHLGMGKPLGMGSVELDATLHLDNRVQRYQRLFQGSGWSLGSQEKPERLRERAYLEARTSAFERSVLAALGMAGKCRHLYQLKRIGILLQLLEWPGIEESEGRYMQLNEYKARPVLPSAEALYPRLAHLTEVRVQQTRTGSDAAGSRPAGQQRGVTLQDLTTVASTAAATTAKPTVLRETVVIVREVKKEKALVRTQQGEEIFCSGIAHPAARVGSVCRADVTREQGKATKATFKGLANGSGR